MQGKACCRKPIWSFTSGGPPAKTATQIGNRRRARIASTGTSADLEEDRLRAGCIESHYQLDGNVLPVECVSDIKRRVGAERMADDSHDILTFLAIIAVREMRDAVEDRRVRSDDDNDDE